MRYPRTQLRTIETHTYRAFVATFLALLILAFAASQARAEPGQPAVQNAGSDGLVHIGDVNSGVLLLRTDTPGLYIPAPATKTDIETWVSGAVARTKITQRFQNPADGWVEGVYVFPMPQDSAVDTLRMQIGDRFIEGDIKERQEARRVFEQALSEGKKASLVEQERPNTFTNSVANIGPHETVIVQIEYQEALPLRDGAFSMRVPLVVAPRYSPKPEATLVSYDGRNIGLNVSDPVPDRERLEAPVLKPEFGKLNPVKITVHLDAGFPLGDIKSETHALKIERDGEGRALVTLKDGETPADRDFVLNYAPKPGDKPYAALVQEEMNGENYFLALVVPPVDKTVRPPVPRETIFVIDNSGSMGGESIRQAKASLLLALDQLRPADRFNVIRFDDTLTVLFSSAVDATQDNIARAKAYVGGLEANGGTEILPAVKAALVDATAEDNTRLRQIVFLTDGQVGNEADVFAEIQQHLGRSRLFTVGIGSAPNDYFMAGAARVGRGTYTFISAPEQVEERMGVLFRKLERPVMTDLAAAWPADTAAEAWPNPLPDLYAGEPVLVTAKQREAGGALTLTGNLAGKQWRAVLDLDNAETGKGIAKVWARNKISALEEQRLQSADWTAIDAGVLKVALDYHLVSRLTSLVAVDITPSRPTGTPIASAKLPLNLPAGWDFDKVFGEEHPSMRAENEVAPAALTKLAMSTTPKSAVVPQDAGLDLPQGATDMRLLLIAGLTTLLLASALLFYARSNAEKAR
jgi:Ca-activated chloride channel family protein